MSITSVAPSTPIRNARSIACMACARSVARVTVNILRHMPGSAGRRAAIGLALLVAACGASPAPTSSSSPAPSASPRPAISASSGLGWVEDLTFGGDLSGTMTVVAPNEAGLQSECSGKNSRSAGNWASTIYGQLGNQKLGVAFLSSQYRGPATYSETVAYVQVFNQDHSKVWQSVDSDPVALTVNADEESGIVEATMTNAANGQSKLKI